MFDAAPSGPDLPLMQDPAFAAALRLCGEAPVTLPSGLLLLSRRILGVPVLMLPRVAPPADLAAQLTQAGVQRCPLILSPEIEAGVQGALQIAPPKPLLRIDLTPPRAERRARLHQNWRHQLGQAMRHNLRVRHSPLPANHSVLKLEAAQARARRYQNWPAALTAAFAQVAPAQTHLLTAKLRGYPVAFMLFLRHGARATYHIGHTTDEGRGVHAHNLLMWEAMEELAAQGVTFLDLGPATTPQIDRFKRRAGATEALTGGTWLRWRPLARSR